MAHPHTGAPADYEPLLTLIGNARFVLLGEASHSTHEFYRERAQITQHPIQEKGFTAVAIAADWPDAYRKMFEVTTLYHHTYCSLSAFGEQYRQAVETPETRGLSV